MYLQVRTWSRLMLGGRVLVLRHKLSREGGSMKDRMFGVYQSIGTCRHNGGPQASSNDVMSSANEGVDAHGLGSEYLWLDPTVTYEWCLGCRNTSPMGPAKRPTQPATLARARRHLFFSLTDSIIIPSISTSGLLEFHTYSTRRNGYPEKGT